VLVPDAGHLVHRERAEEMNRLLLDRLTNGSVGGKRPAAV
jgi:hypothetical protein